MRRVKCLILLVYLISLQSFAGGGTSQLEEDYGKVIDVFKHYNSLEGVRMDTTKKVYTSFSEETKKSSGDIVLSKKKLRLNITKPEPSLMLVLPETIWIENHIPKDLGGGVQVTKINANKEFRKKNTFLAALFGNSKVWQEFEPLKSNSKGDALLLLQARPKDKEARIDVPQVQIVVNPKDKKLISIKHWDALDNWTEFIFSKVEFNPDLKKVSFKYKVPKGVTPTEM